MRHESDSAAGGWLLLFALVVLLSAPLAVGYFVMPHAPAKVAAIPAPADPALHTAAAD